MKLLNKLNSEYSKLHKDYEEAFWLSYMGDHSFDDDMERARIERDKFRENDKLRAMVKATLAKAKGKEKLRLKIWSDFFDLYQTPAKAVSIKNEIGKLEAEIKKMKTKGDEGYIDPYSKNKVHASKNKMTVIMRTHPDENVRKACFVSLEKLPLIALEKYVKVVKLRNKYARALGFQDFYDYKIHIDEKMSKKELFSIFDKIYKKTRYVFDNIRLLEKDKPGLRKPWNFAYMMSGDFVKEEDQYFRFENVLSYWGRSMTAMGLDLNGGELKMDLLDRQGKYSNGFCHYPDLVRRENGKWMPGSSNISSNAIPSQVGSGMQAINTVFHEGGHAADRLNSRQPDVCINHEYPPSTVSWAETHSMFMDSISSSVEWKTRYATNDKGEIYPFELFERKMRAIYPLRSGRFMGIASVVFFEKEIYECKNLTAKKALSIAKKVRKKFADQSEESISILNVPHIYSWETSAYYHGYGLAELGVSQWRSYFFKKYGYIVDNPKVGKEMKKIWSYASLYPAKKLIKMATGKKLGPESFISSLTRPLEDIINGAKKKVARLKKVPKYDKPVDLKGKITMVHGKEIIADNSKSFEDMEKKYREWLQAEARSRP